MKKKEIIVQNPELLSKVQLRQHTIFNAKKSQIISCRTKCTKKRMQTKIECNPNERNEEEQKTEKQK